MARSPQEGAVTLSLLVQGLPSQEAQRQRIRLPRRRLEFDPWVGKIPQEKEMATHSSILA